MRKEKGSSAQLKDVVADAAEAAVDRNGSTESIEPEKGR